MVKKVNKKNTKAKKKVLTKGKKPAETPKTTLGDIIKNADQAVIITTSKGNIEVTGIKDINYAFEVKGLLIGALDVYNSRPILNGINNNSKALLSHIMNQSNKLDKIIAAIEEEGK